MAEDAHAIGLEDDQVFDAHATPAGQVDARLDGKDHTWSEWLVTARLGQRWWLVDFKPDTVAQAMGEGVAVAGATNDVARERVGLSTGHAWPHLLLGMRLCLENNAVELDETLIERLPQTDGAGHVGAIATG
jgi:hypothetical protein